MPTTRTIKARRPRGTTRRGTIPLSRIRQAITDVTLSQARKDWSHAVVVRGGSRRAVLTKNQIAATIADEFNISARHAVQLYEDQAVKAYKQDRKTFAIKRSGKTFAFKQVHVNGRSKRRLPIAA